MADNVAITPGTGATVAADDIAGVLHQRVKISQGADGAATDVSSAAPLQVTLANTDANTNKLLVTPDLPSGAATAAKQPALGTAGSASADVITIQGKASMTPIDVNSHAVTNAGTFAVQAASSTATGSAVPANAFYSAGINSSGNLVGFKDFSMNDAQSTGAAASGIVVWNGTNADKGRSATAAANTTGTGLLGAGDMNLSASALPTANTAARYTPSMSDNFGRKVVIPGTIRDLVGTQTTTISASTSETTIATAVASTFLDLTALVISNTSATATRVDFRDTTAGSVLFSLYVPAGDVRGVAFNRPVPQSSVNTNWTAQSSASVTDLRVYAIFDKNK